MWTTPEKHTKTTETLRNANQNNTTRRAEYKKVNDPPHTHPSNPLPTPKHSELKEHYEIMNKTKTLTTIAR